MNWSKAKTILIIFFLIINITLVCDIIFTSNKSTAVTPEIINSTVEVLAKNDIKIDSDIIPSKNSVLQSAEVENIISDPSVFAETVFGENVTEISDCEYRKNDCSLSICGDKFHFKTDNTLPSPILSNIDDNTVLSKSKELLSSFGISLGDCYSIFEKTDNGYKVKFIKKINSKPLFGSEIFVIINQNTLVEFYGSWFNESVGYGINDKIQLNSPTSALVEFILDKQRPKSAITISDLTLGYYIGDDTIYHKSIVLIPAWKITLDNNMCYYVDARKSK